MTSAALANSALRGGIEFQEVTRPCGVLDGKPRCDTVGLGGNDLPGTGGRRAAVARSAHEVLDGHPMRPMPVGVPSAVWNLAQCIHTERRPLRAMFSESVIEEIENIADLPDLRIDHGQGLGLFQQWVIVVEPPGFTELRQEHNGGENKCDS